MLHEVGKVLRSSFRESDVLGRVGGDEFLLLLKNIDLEVALDKLEQVKRQLAAVKVGSQGKALSVSMGVYVPEDDDLAYRDVFVKADEALYRAKRSGKNRICVPRPLGSFATSVIPLQAPIADLLAILSAGGGAAGVEGSGAPPALSAWRI
ncbi:MAG: GGDEF domain-containing protein [Eggerthella lenta]